MSLWEFRGFWGILQRSQDDRLVIKGRTDQNGLTHYVTTTNPENIRIEIDTKE